MSRDRKQEQDQNTAKLVMNAFYKIADEHGASALDITNYLQDKFGDVWKISSLKWKAEETLQKSAMLGFLERQGSRYVANIARALAKSRARRKRRTTCRKKSRKSCKKRPRPRAPRC